MKSSDIVSNCALGLGLFIKQPQIRSDFIFHWTWSLVGVILVAVPNYSSSLCY